MPMTNEVPGKGHYICTSCGQMISLNYDHQSLPVCPRCENEVYDKVES